MEKKQRLDHRTQSTLTQLCNVSPKCNPVKLGRKVQYVLEMTPVKRNQVKSC